MTTFKRILGILLGLCYVGFAALQYNDPDAAAWIATYLVAAVLSFMAAFGKAKKSWLFIAFVAFAIGAVIFIPEKWEGLEIGGGDIKNIEEAREALGLAMCSISMLVLALLTRSSTYSKPVL